MSLPFSDDSNCQRRLGIPTSDLTGISVAAHVCVQCGMGVIMREKLMPASLAQS